MTEPMTEPMIMAPAAGQLQLFTDLRSGGPVHWRLLSGNNREAGRGALALPDERSCVAAIERLRRALPQTTARVQRADAQRWRWELLWRGEVVAVSGRSFDRGVRCRLAVDHFTTLLAAATAPAGVVVVRARRFERRAS